MLNRFEQQLKHSIDRATGSTSTRASSATVGDGVLYAELSHAIVGAAIEVHRRIGPGQLELLYQRALVKELEFREIPHRAQVPIEMLYRGSSIGDMVVDLIVDDTIVVELKAVSKFAAVHTAQVLSYLRATNLRLGLLINFNVPVLWRGVHRVVRG